MKRNVFLIIVQLVGSGCVTVWPLAASGATATASATNVPAGPSMSRIDQEKAAYQAEIQPRLSQLEKLGEVPEKADRFDWQVAQETSWWGTPLDPEKFWKDRVVWMDDSATSAAARHGRTYPPMPYIDSTLPHFKDEGDIQDLSGAVEGPALRVHFTNKEAVFWDKFSKTHPKPPETLEREQTDMAQRILDRRQLVERGGNPARLTRRGLEADERIEKQRASEVGFPPELFTEDALFWKYVLAQRQEYQNLVNATHSANNVAVSNLLAQLSVDSKYVTDPLPRDAIQKASAWKIAYLQGLSKEKVDQSYINAYLKAWNLKPGEVFTSATISPQPTR